MEKHSKRSRSKFLTNLKIFEIKYDIVVKERATRERSLPLFLHPVKEGYIMTLIETLAALSNNTNVNITLVDDQDNQLITFNAVGYQSVESDLGARVVKYIKVSSGTLLTIALKEANGNTGDPSSDPSGNPSDPSGDPSSDPTGDP